VRAQLALVPEATAWQSRHSSTRQILGGSPQGDRAACAAGI